MSLLRVTPRFVGIRDRAYAEYGLKTLLSWVVRSL